MKYDFPQFWTTPLRTRIPCSVLPGMTNYIGLVIIFPNISQKCEKAALECFQSRRRSRNFVRFFCSQRVLRPQGSFSAKAIGSGRKLLSYILTSKTCQVVQALLRQTVKRNTSVIAKYGFKMTSGLMSFPFFRFLVAFLLFKLGEG